MKRTVVLKALSALIFCLWSADSIAISSLAKNDPYPVYSTKYPYCHLLERTKNYLKGWDNCYKRSWMSASVSPFFQKANRGRTYEREKVPLGDLEGRWNMLGMTYGPVPEGQTLVDKQLGAAKLALFEPNLLPTGNDPNSVVPMSSILTDSTERVGYFSVPLKYRKQGARFEVCFQPFEDFGFMIQGGYADIKQTLTDFVNLTINFTQVEEAGLKFEAEDLEIINCYLMTQSTANKIFLQQGLDVCDFRDTSFEDLRFAVWFRHMFEVNRNNCEYPEFLFIPFAAFEASVPIAKKRDRTKAFALPFGNDGHSSVAFTAGIHIDFYETIEIGIHGGMTHFFSRDIDNYRLPNARLQGTMNPKLAGNFALQTGVFPFATSVKVQPGRNTHFGALLHAYRFIGKLSFHAEYIQVNHDEDDITVTGVNTGVNAGQPNAVDDENRVFYPEQQECFSKFQSQFLNTMFNYEISPNISLGFGVQWPLNQRNAYRSTTIIGSITGTF